jgi:uncharacterized protein (DUF2062 family)
MKEFRITIGSKGSGSGPNLRRPQSKLELLKAVILTLLALSAVIGILLAAFVVGSIIASLLLILLAVSILVWLIRRFFLTLRREQTKL